MQGERSITTLCEHVCFGGVQGDFLDVSETIGIPMKFGVFVPPRAKAGLVLVLIFLAGPTCSKETFGIKAGAQQHAALHGLMLVTPDTSPRGTGVERADTAWDFGTADGHCLDATELVKAGARVPPLLVDQGLADNFLAEQLHPHPFEAACQEAGQPLMLRRHEGYDHSYFFISTFMSDHIAHRARFLCTA